LGHRGSEVERTAFGPLGQIRSLGAQSLEGSRPTDLGGASWVAASATPDMSSEDPALQPPVLEPWWDGDGEGHPHPGMFESDRSVIQSLGISKILNLPTCLVILFVHNSVIVIKSTYSVLKLSALH